MASSMILGHQATRQAMGVKATITVHATDPFTLIERGFSLLARCENLWSRFLAHSDISRLNTANGAPIEVDATTVDLVAHMKAAHNATGGRFNPTLLPLHRNVGDMHSLVDSHFTSLLSNAQTWESLDAITFVSPTHIVIPPTMTLDAGGIGKGFAADLIVDDLLDNGAVSVSVNIGGDARVASQPAFHESWHFDIVDSQITSPVSTVSLLNGAVATSSVDARYRNGTGPLVHLFSVDDRTPTLHTCSVIAPQARWAEIWTKFIMLSPSPARDISEKNLTALTVDSERTIYSSSSWKEFEL